MCTVSIIGLDDGVRLVCNRDEARGRPAALPPIEIVRRGVRVLMPVDPESRGTWIAVNETGLAFVVLNVNDGTAPNPRLRTRGGIVPKLMGATTLADAASAALGLIVAAYRPFRLIVASREGVIELTSARVVRSYSLASPLMFTSSGLGDGRVDGCRRRLFERLMSGRRNLAAKQDRFHAHRWPLRPHLSVLMSRDDACTVSRTTIQLASDGIEMTYEPQPVGVATRRVLPTRA